MKLKKGYMFCWSMFGYSITLLAFVDKDWFNCQIWRKYDCMELYFHKKTLVFVKTDYKTAMRTKQIWKLSSLCQKGVAGLLSVAGLFYVALYVW